MLSHETKGYFNDNPRYDANNPSPIKGYVHPGPDRFRFRNPSGRVSRETIQEIQELVLQALDNWPTESPATIVSSRANIDPTDAAFMTHWLIQDGTLTGTWDPATGRYGAELTYANKSQVHKPTRT